MSKVDLRVTEDDTQGQPLASYVHIKQQTHTDTQFEEKTFRTIRKITKSTIISQYFSISNRKRNQNIK